MNSLASLIGYVATNSTHRIYQSSASDTTIILGGESTFEMRCANTLNIYLQMDGESHIDDMPMILLMRQEAEMHADSEMTCLSVEGRSTTPIMSGAGDAECTLYYNVTFQTEMEGASGLEAESAMQNPTPASLMGNSTLTFLLENKKDGSANMSGDSSFEIAFKTTVSFASNMDGGSDVETRLKNGDEISYTVTGFTAPANSQIVFDCATLLLTVDGVQVPYDYDSFNDLIEIAPGENEISINTNRTTGNQYRIIYNERYI